MSLNLNIIISNCLPPPFKKFVALGALALPPDPKWFIWIIETCLDSGGTLSLGESPVPGNQNIIRALAILTQQMATIGLWVYWHDLSQQWAEFGYRTVTTLGGAVRSRTRPARSRELFNCFVILLDIWRKVRTGTYRSHYLCTEWTEWEDIDR